MNSDSIGQKIKNLFRKYSYYMLLGVLLLAVVLTIVVAGVVSSNDKGGGMVEDVSVTISPYLPVLNATIYKDYYGDELCYNQTLKQWETHNGIDFQAASGSSVYSILDGRVIDVYSNILEGAVVVVEHENGLISTYASLDDEVLVQKGDDVNRGQELGTISSTSSSEADAGAHLHFSITDNGNKINPASYLNIGNK
jgi:murein DD-endopeptidase MepM/ murein hydrolase activator NlpD